MQTVAVLPRLRRRNGAPVAARLERLRSHVGSLAAYPSVKGAQERARGLLVPQLLDATPPVAYATAVLTGYVAGDYVPIFVVGAVLLLLRISPWLAFTAGTVLAMMVGTDAPAMLLTVYASVYLCRRRVAGRLSWAAAVATLACLPWAFQQFGEFGPYSSTQPEALLGLLSALSAAEIARTVSAKQRLEQETMTLQEQGRAREERADRLDQRSRLARELHDVVGHHVTAMVVQAEAGLARGSEQATTSLHRIADLGRSALNDLDTMVHALREPDEGIAWTSAPRITDLPRLADPLEDSGVSVRLQVGDDLNLDAAQELTVYGRKLVDAVASGLKVDVALVDIRMPGMDGLAATKALAGMKDAPAVVIVTTFGEEEYVLEALAAGASGFLLKRCSGAELVSAIRAVAAGDAILSPEITRTVIERMRSRRLAPTPRLDDLRLTPRETSVLAMIGQGLTNTEISAGLFLSESTVKTHVGNILSKTRSRDRVQAALLANRLGLAPH